MFFGVLLVKYSCPWFGVSGGRHSSISSFVTNRKSFNIYLFQCTIGGDFGGEEDEDKGRLITLLFLFSFFVVYFFRLGIENRNISL